MFNVTMNQHQFHEEQWEQLFVENCYFVVPEIDKHMLRERQKDER